MNCIIQACNNVPYSLLDNIYADLFTTWSLYFFVISICAWLINKNKNYFRFALTSLFAFTALHIYSKLIIRNQKKILVYNIPKHQAIDFIYQDKYFFYGDSSMMADGALRNFHLKPARVFMQAFTYKSNLPELFKRMNEWRFCNKTICIIDSAINFLPVENKIKTDILIISKNPSLKIAGLVSAIKPSIIVFDASNSLWKIAGWKKECLSLALPFFSIPEQGAFIMNVK